MRRGHDHSAWVSWLSVSTISVAFQRSANFRARSDIHSRGCDVMNASARSVQ